jgi:hypothetical protein
MIPAYFGKIEHSAAGTSSHFNVARHDTVCPAADSSPLPLNLPDLRH